MSKPSHSKPRGVAKRGLVSSCAARQARRLVGPIRSEIISLLQKLVQTDSTVTPPNGNEAAAQKVLEGFCKSHGLDVETYDTGFLRRRRHRLVRKNRSYSGRPNLIVRLPGAGRAKSLLLTGHIDTVPVGAGKWRYAPLSGQIVGGRLYGRGSFDMKAGLAAHFGVALAVRKAGIALAGDLLCESVVDEEWAGGGGTLAGRLRGDNADACVITEGTGLSVVRATRGGHFFEITAEAGDPAAYFSKTDVVSPAPAMGRLLGWIDDWSKRRRRIRRPAAYREFDDPVPVQILALEANRMESGTPWAVPLSAGVRVYFQFLPGENVPAVIGQVKRSFARFCKSDIFFRLHPPKWTDITDPPLLGHEISARHPWTRCLTNCASEALGSEVEATAAPYPCDAFICQREFSMPTLLFGPTGGGAHNVNEYVNVRSVIQATEVLLASALSWCGG